MVSRSCIRNRCGPSPEIFAVVYRRIVPRLGHANAIGALIHGLCRLIWKVLHERVRYEERGSAVRVEAKKVRARKMIRELRGVGYRVELAAPSPGLSVFRPWLMGKAEYRGGFPRGDRGESGVARRLKVRIR